MELQKFLDGDAVGEALGVHKSARHRYVQEGLLTRPLKLSPRCARWPSGEIAKIQAARIAGADDEAVRTLVAQLHAARQQAA